MQVADSSSSSTLFARLISSASSTSSIQIVSAGQLLWWDDFVISLFSWVFLDSFWKNLFSNWSRLLDSGLGFTDLGLFGLLSLLVGLFGELLFCTL